MLNSIVRQTLSLLSKYRSQKIHALDELAEFRALVQDVDRINLQDFGISADEFFKTSVSDHSELKHSEAPVNYMEVYEDGLINISIFALRHGDVELPLHDHPEMYGILKVIYGKVEILQMTPVSENQSGSQLKILDRFIPNRQRIYCRK